MELLNENSFKIHAIDNLFEYPTNLYNIDGTINQNCVRTFIGNLHYNLKVNKKSENISLISDALIEYMEEINQIFDVIIPVPSKKNNNVYRICSDVSIKTNILLLNIIQYVDDKLVVMNKNCLSGKKVLLVDDTYNTGFTLKYIYSQISHLCSDVTGLVFVVNR